MPVDPNNPAESAYAATEILDVGSSRPMSSPSDATAHAKVEIVAGKRESLSAQERETLRKRLTAGAIVVLFGFGIYLVRSYFDDRPLQGLHTLVVFALSAVIVVLVSQVELTTKHLRWLELAIFGIPVLFFVPYHYLCVMQQLEAEDPVGIVAIYKNVASYWFCLLVIYGLFVPNNWKRTLIVVTPMVILPVATGVVAAIRHPMVGQNLDVRQLTDTFMILCVGALCAAYGAEVIQSLRKEAREAREFGQYRLVELIGKGGMGEVYKAEHRLLKRPCAIKLIRPERAGDKAALARFEREVRATAKLTHWNTIDIYDYGRTDDGMFYYVMEYLPGLNIKQMLRVKGPMSPERVAYLVCQICDALSEAHAQEFVHRDINSGNVFVTKQGGFYDVAKLLDFGLVKTSANSGETQITQFGSVSGTPTYMSPEQASGDLTTKCSDIYSLGAVAYTMLTGRPPFTGGSAMEVMISHVRDDAPDVGELRQDVPMNLQNVIHKCLKKSPADRFQNAADLKQAIEDCDLADGWTQARAATWWQMVMSEAARKEAEQEKLQREVTVTVDSQASAGELH